MAMYLYVKSSPVVASIEWKNFKKKRDKALLQTLPNFMIGLGFLAVVVVSFPMISYQIGSAGQKTSKQLGNFSTILGSETKKDFQNSDLNAKPTPIIVENIDYNKASNWFINAKPINLDNAQKPNIDEYGLSIPKLDIDNMTVKIGGENLDEHIIQYAGTALPGQYGNTVVFGHSMLPIFYNPTNYLTVFTKIPSLTKGDEILVNYDGVRYKYVFDSYEEIEPTDIEVLEQYYDTQTLKLVTCVPPGTTLRRGVVTAKLVK